MNQDQASGIKIFHEIEALEEVIDMLELWLNKVDEARELKKCISIVETSGGNATKNILVKNMNVEHIRKVKDIVNDLMNMDTTISDSDKDIEKLED